MTTTKDGKDELEDVIFGAMELADNDHRIPCRDCAKGIANVVRSWIARQLPDKIPCKTEWDDGWNTYDRQVKSRLL